MLAFVKSLFVSDSKVEFEMLEEEKLRKYLRYSYSMRRREAVLRLDMSYGFDEICHRHLYLGNYSSISVESIKQYSITHVVNCTKDLPTPARIQGVKFIRVAVDDHPSSKIKKHFDSVLNKMFDAIKTGGKVLVICRAGISRSSTVVMAFLMKFHNMMLRDAHKLVKSQRPKIRPNDGFWRQLIEYERVIFKCSSVTLIRTMGGIVPSVYLNSTLNQNYMQIT